MKADRLPVGAHVLLDLRGIPAARLDNLEDLRSGFVQAAVEGGATVVDARFTRFEPQGVSGVVILAESHLALHTWHALGYAAVDVFTCGSPQVASAVADAVVRLLSPAACERRELARGPGASEEAR